MDLVAELKSHIAGGEAVIVVGSGISIQATSNAPCASWTGLLDDGVDYALGLGRLSKKSADPLRKQIRSKDTDLLLAAAHAVTAKLGADFGAWLQRSVGALRLINREVIEPLRHLGVLATTNYDHLLTEVTGLAPVPWTDEAAVEQVLRGGRKGILHLHGSYHDPDSVILDVRSYQRLIDSEHSHAVLTSIRTLKTLVFVGCGEGLADPHFATFFKWTEQAFEKSHFPHFILCRRKEVAKIQRQHLPERKLQPVAYGKEYGELPAFLTSLAPPRPVERTLPDAGPCFGRDDEIHGIVTALVSGSPARISVLGTAGLGKTTLTLKALHDNGVQQRYGDAMYFIRCDAASSLDGLVGAIATELGVTGVQQLSRAVVAALSEKPCVLVLDNFETPWQAMTLEVEEFLKSLTGIESLQLIVTLRGKERPAGVLWRDPIEPPLLSLPAARQAFLAIAGSRFAGDPKLDELLELMDRLPLAISLLAYVAQSEPSLDVLMERWTKKRTAMLQRAGGRQRLTNFEVSFELSISSPRLTAEAHRLLSVLAVLPAGIVHRDLAKVFPDGDEVASVLRQTGLAFDEGGRLRMLAPLRAYVSDHYPVSEADEERMTDHYLKMTEQIRTLARTTGGDVVLSSLPPEAANIESAIVREIERGRLNRVESASVMHSYLIRNTGIGSLEPIRLLAARADAAQNPVALSHALRGLANVALWSGQVETAREYLDRALAIDREQKNKADETWDLHSLGLVESRLGRHAEAAAKYEEVIRLCTETKDERGRANALADLARTDVVRGQFESAKRRLDEALSLFRRLEMIGGEAFCIRAQAQICFFEGDLDASRARCEEALTLFQKTGDLLHEGDCYRLLSSVDARKGDKVSALANSQEALVRFERIRDLQNVGSTHRNLASLETDPTQCAHHLAAARAAWTSIGRDDLVKTLDG